MTRCELTSRLLICKTTELLDELHQNCADCHSASVSYLVKLLQKLDIDEYIHQDQPVDDHDKIDNNDLMRDKIVDLLSSYSKKIKSDKREIIIGHHDKNPGLGFFMRETDFDTDLFGCKTWSCSILFALILKDGVSTMDRTRLPADIGDGDQNKLNGENLTQEIDSWTRNKLVLEMGAGTGLSGLALSKLYQPKMIVQTDYLTSILENIFKNCQINESTRNRVALLNWESPECMIEYSESKLLNSENQDLPGQFDCIIATDICYDVASASLAASTIRYRLKSKIGKAMILLPKRFNYDRELEAFRFEMSKLKYDTSPILLKYQCIIHTNDYESRFQDIFDKGLEEDFVLFIYERH